MTVDHRVARIINVLMLLALGCSHLPRAAVATGAPLDVALAISADRLMVGQLQIDRVDPKGLMLKVGEEYVYTFDGGANDDRARLASLVNKRVMAGVRRHPLYKQSWQAVSFGGHVFVTDDVAVMELAMAIIDAEGDPEWLEKAKSLETGSWAAFILHVGQKPALETTSELHAMGPGLGAKELAMDIVGWYARTMDEAMAPLACSINTSPVGVVGTTSDARKIGTLAIERLLGLPAGILERHDWDPPEAVRKLWMVVTHCK